MGLFSTILQVGGGIIGTFLGASDNKKAIGKATDAQLAMLQKGIDEQARQYDLSRGDVMPWMESGKLALGDMGDLLGLNGPEAAAAAIAALKASPMFTSLFNTGEEAILQNASATGGVRGGNTQRSLADFGADLLAQVIQQQLGNLGGISGAGVGAAGNLGQLGGDTANAIQAGMAGMGNSQYNSIIGKQQVNNDMVEQIQSLIMKAVGGGF